MKAPHYSETLRNRIVENENKMNEIEAELINLLRYLSSDKFAGVENNFVNASEMFNRVFEIRNKLDN